MQARRSQSGFSLIELMVAMVATLIVTGAIFGLLSGGQGAFRREPEVVDMQQNLRMAMDIMVRDVGGAGTGMEPAMIHSTAQVQNLPFVQIFTRNLDDGHACDVACVSGDPCPCPRPLEPTSTAQHTDDIEMMVGNSECGAEEVCGYQGKAQNMRLSNEGSCLKDNDTPIIIMADGTWTMRQVSRDPKPDNGKPGGTAPEPGCGNVGPNPHADIGFSPNFGLPGMNPAPADLCTPPPKAMGNVTDPNCVPVYTANAALITYRIAPGADGVPNLERRASDDLQGATLGQSFQVVARGIEDMQVQYARASEPWHFCPDPNDITCPADFATGAPQAKTGDTGTLVTQVRITLSGRTSTQRNLQGERADVRGNRFVRSTLTTTVAVRSSLQKLSQEFAPNPTPPRWN